MRKHTFFTREAWSIAWSRFPVLRCREGHGYGECREDHNAFARRWAAREIDEQLVEAPSPPSEGG